MTDDCEPVSHQSGDDSERCPSCERPAIGGLAVELKTRGTGNLIDGVVCETCRTVWVPEGDSP